MGPISATGKGKGARRAEPKVAGYEVREDSVALRCPDVACAFHRALPVYVIDEDVYEQAPVAGHRDRRQVRDAGLPA